MITTGSPAGSAAGTGAGTTSGSTSATTLDATVLPTLPGSIAYGPATTTGNKTSQSFRVTGMTPAEALDAYAGLAAQASWTTVDPPHADISSAPTSSGWTATFTRNGSVLSVTAALGTGDTGSQQDVVELSLQLTGP